MPILSSGSNVTLTVAAGQILTVQSDQATFDFENPVGTRVGEYASDSVFGPFTTAASVKITSVQGAVFYDLATPTNGGSTSYNPANVVITGGSISGVRSNEFFNFTSANMRKWRVALAKMRSGTYRPKVALIGDSTTRGVGSNGAQYVNSEVNSYPEQLAAQLTAAGISAQANSIFGDGSMPSLATADPRLTLGTGWTSSTPTLGGGMFNTAAATGFLGFQPVPNVDTFDIYTAQQSGLGTGIVNINGGATLATIIESNATRAVIKTTVAGSLAANQVRLTQSSGAIYVIGIDGYNSATKSVSVMNMGWSAQTADGYVNQGGGSWNAPYSLPYVAPDLTVVCLTINDWRAALSLTGLAAYTTALQSLITAAKSTGDCVLMIGVPSATTSAPASDQAAVIAINYSLALSNGIPLIDLSSRWSDYTTSNGLGMYYDVLHPNQPGYSDMARAVGSAMMQYA